MKVDVVGIVFQALLDLSQKSPVLLISPRIAEGKPVVLDIWVELEAEGNFDLIFLIPSL